MLPLVAVQFVTLLNSVKRGDVIGITGQARDWRTRTRPAGGA